MCGIAGVVCARKEIDPAAAKRLAGVMNATLAHRGPDDTGVWQSTDGTVTLCHRRLSIIDLSPLGHNPMCWDGRLWITFNGEIYNYRELRRELQALGHAFKSQTDTEVILAAYDEWGLDSVHRLVGMFAFALWDERQRQLWLVRDRLGKKPLYYSEHGHSLRFASELKAFAGDPAFPRDVDPDGLRLYLRYGYIPAPFTIYREARKLPPAHYLLWANGTTTTRRYWDPVASAQSVRHIDARQAEVELDQRLSLAVRQRQIADVPLGAFLSGGIDSSLIVALMREQTTARVQTFTIRFDNPEYNEADHAAAVARHLGTDHHEETCNDAQLLAAVAQVPTMFDEPFADSSAVPTFVVSKMARKHVTVALSGDGGDELFFGYPRYNYYASGAVALALPPALRRTAGMLASRLPTRRLKRIADVLSSDDEDRYLRFVTWWDQSRIRAMTGGESPAAPLYADVLARTAGLHRNARPPLLDLVSYLAEDILTKVDRASMAVSLEVRAPLLDHRVVEYALSLPHTLKKRGGSTKWLLRRLLYKRVPRRLVDRPKMGFGVPLGDWFRGPLGEQMDSYCRSDAIEGLGITPEPIRQLWSDFRAGRGHRTDLVWQIYVLAAWARQQRASRQVPAELH